MRSRSISWRRMTPVVRRAAVVPLIGLAVALAGCSAPPAGLTPAELQKGVELQNEARWAGLYPSGTVEPPDVPVVRFINLDDDAVWDCMSDAGVPVEIGADGSVSWSSEPLGVEATSLLQYTCQAQYPLYPPQAGTFTEEQHAYLYDYYQDVLVPCIELHGYEVEDAPSRAEFDDLTTIDSFWNPFSFLSNPIGNEAHKALRAQCPDNPFRAPVPD